MVYIIISFNNLIYQIDFHQKQLLEVTRQKISISTIVMFPIILFYLFEQFFFVRLSWKLLKSLNSGSNAQIFTVVAFFGRFLMDRIKNYMQMVETILKHVELILTIQLII